jgi:hypothetical protein
MPALIPSPSVRVAPQPDGLLVWLVIPHPLRSTSFLLEASGALWCAISLVSAGSAQEQCWLARLDCATGDLSFEPMLPGLAWPQLRRDPGGAPCVLALEHLASGSPPRWTSHAVVQPLGALAATLRAPLPAGHVLPALGPDGLLFRVLNKAQRTTHLTIDRGAGEPSSFELPRGWALLDATPTATGHALIGIARAGLRWISLDHDLRPAGQEARLDAGGATPQALVREEPDGSLLALGRRGHELGTLRISRTDAARFVPIVTLPFPGLDAATILAPHAGSDGSVTAEFRFSFDGHARQGTGALRIEADGSTSYLYTSMDDSPGLIHRPGGPERASDDPLSLDFHDRAGAHEVAVFERRYEPPSGYTPHRNQLLRVWRR